MQQIAENRDLETLDAPLSLADGERVEQRLRRVFVGAVAGVDHPRAPNLAGEQTGRAGLRAPHHDQVGRHRSEGLRRVEQGPRPC